MKSKYSIRLSFKNHRSIMKFTVGVHAQLRVTISQRFVIFLLILALKGMVLFYSYHTLFREPPFNVIRVKFLGGLHSHYVRQDQKAA